MDVWDVVKGNGCVKDATREELLVLSFNLPPFLLPLKTAARSHLQPIFSPQTGEGAISHLGRKYFLMFKTLTYAFRYTGSSISFRTQSLIYFEHSLALPQPQL